MSYFYIHSCDSAKQLDPLCFTRPLGGAQIRLIHLKSCCHTSHSALCSCQSGGKKDQMERGGVGRRLWGLRHTPSNQIPAVSCGTGRAGPKKLDKSGPRGPQRTQREKNVKCKVGVCGKSWRWAWELISQAFQEEPEWWNGWNSERNDFSFYRFGRLNYYKETISNYYLMF